MAVTVEQVRATLAAIVDPATGKDLVSSTSAKNICVDRAHVSVDVELDYPAKSQLDPIRRAVIGAIRALPGVENASASVRQKIVSHAVQQGVRPLPGVKNVIAVASGKGGVGKSTTAVNLALALAAEGAQVGMLDADIYGPSQPQMLGISGRPRSTDGKTLEPMEGHGIQATSIGFLSDTDAPMIWRGPMATQALEQLLRQTNWRDLDYLVVDLPPGTGDVHLSLPQRIPVTGAVIVTTPQDIALLDARKGLKMFEQVNIPILGIVENMAIHRCSNCGHAEHIFGAGGRRTDGQRVRRRASGWPAAGHPHPRADRRRQPHRRRRPRRRDRDDLQADRTARGGEDRRACEVHDDHVPVDRRAEHLIRPASLRRSSCDGRQIKNLLTAVGGPIPRNPDIFVRDSDSRRWLLSARLRKWLPHELARMMDALIAGERPGEP